MAKTKKDPGKIRLLIQCAFAALSNGHLIGFATGKIYTGPLKVLCAPGMNCYSCPGALGSCPIGALQAVLSSKQYHVALYVLGLLTVMGTFFGRLICGFLCPFGLVQDLLHKIPFSKKVRKLPGERYWRWLRFVLLGLFVILLPMTVHNLFGIGDPWFCKYICPVGIGSGRSAGAYEPGFAGCDRWTLFLEDCYCCGHSGWICNDLPTLLQIFVSLGRSIRSVQSFCHLPLPH